MSGTTAVSAPGTLSYPSIQESTKTNNQFAQLMIEKKGLSYLDLEERLTELLFKNMHTGLDKAKALAILTELKDFTSYSNFFCYYGLLKGVYIQNVLSNDHELPFSFLEEMFLLLVNSNVMNDRDLTEFKECCWIYSLPQEYWPYLEKPKPQTAIPPQSYRPGLSIPGYSVPRNISAQQPVAEIMDHFEIFFNKKLSGFLDACKIIFTHLPLTDHETRICNDRGETTVGKFETVFTALLQESAKPEFKKKMDITSNSAQLKTEYEKRRAIIAQLRDQLKLKLSTHKV